MYSVVNDLNILFVFIDGLGIGSDDPKRNALLDSRFPTLGKLIASATPVDACLGVDGLPQSATGQTTLLTGENASKVMGRHVEGFPPPTLKTLIESENLFSKLQNLGQRCTFANSYWIDDPHTIPLRRQSVTTVMSLKAFGAVRGKEELLAGKAVNHDITRWTMHTRGYTSELISPETAAEHLITVAEENNFTLFESFLSDRAGRSGDPELVFQCRETLERFLSAVIPFAEKTNRLFLLCSDHGNIEDNSTKRHTKNPVPLVALGTGASTFNSVKSLADITPAILRLYEA